MPNMDTPNNRLPRFPILIIGGGIAGVTAAVELAEAGREVILIEKEAYLGGNVLKMHNYFPKLCPPACGMEINFRRIRNNRRIRVITHTEAMDIAGIQGAMKVTVRTRPRLVNDLCTACGDCVPVCPVSRPDSFNYNVGETKAIYQVHPLSYPQIYEIDPNHCTGIDCGLCVDACQYGAINFNEKEVIDTLDVHAVIVATGWKNFDPSVITGLGYDESPDIVSNVEFERLLSLTGPTNGHLVRPSNGKAPESVAFVQCAGSRDRNYLPYCSSVCCSASLKHALNVAELLPDVQVKIFYIDLRVYGRNEDFLKRVEHSMNIKLVKGKVAHVEADDKDGRIIVEAEDIELGKKCREEFDMVVLATGIIPSNDVPGTVADEEGFYSVQQETGIYSTACAKRPMDVSASVKDATAAALKAMK